MSVHVGYTVTDNAVPQRDSGPSTARLAQSYTPTKSLQIMRSEHIPWQLAVLIGAWVALSGLVAFLQGWEAGES